jgi:dipeptidyl aminopeptidase/acylaminoacyl peptidase
MWEGTGGNPEQSSDICAMICMSGPYDLKQCYIESNHQRKQEGKAVRGMLEAFLGGRPSQVGAKYVTASPLGYASKTTVPALLTHGTEDPLVPIKQSEVFAARLREVGVDIEFLRLERAGHADFGRKPQETIAQITAFVQKHIVEAKPSTSSPALPFRANGAQ